MAHSNIKKGTAQESTFDIFKQIADELERRNIVFELRID